MCERVHNTTDFDDATGEMSLCRKFPKAFRSSEAQKYKNMPDGNITFFVCMYSEEPIYHLS